MVIESDDITQELALAEIRGTPKLRRPLTRSMYRHEALQNRLRGVHVHEESAFPDVSDTVANLELVQIGCAVLTRIEADVIHRRWWRGQRSRAIAAELGVSVRTVQLIARRAIRAMRERLACEIHS